MKNLIEEASTWLRSNECNNGSVRDRTQAVIASFQEYVKSNQAEIISNTGLSYTEINEIIDRTSKSINRILSAFLRGNHYDALKYAFEMLRPIKLDLLGTEIPMYKCRENSRLFHFSKEEMFHIPYDKRDMVGNQRYSVSGLPCLYLGGSSYICWEELGRVDFNTSNFCGYKLLNGIKTLDMLLPQSIEHSHQIKMVVIILACSLSAKRTDFFKPEYILSQCIFHSQINRSYYNHSLFCVRYYSSHLFNGDADYFQVDNTSSDELSRYVNYVFPAPSSQQDGYNKKLKDLFVQTETISLLHKTLIKPERMVSYCSNDVYLNSQFGLVDAIIDERLGLVPKREEGGLLLFSQDD